MKFNERAMPKISCFMVFQWGTITLSILEPVFGCFLCQISFPQWEMKLLYAFLQFQNLFLHWTPLGTNCLLNLI